jgi:prepilin-type N-terminal cleavage/methylation domain-containing protein
MPQGHQVCKYKEMLMCSLKLATRRGLSMIELLVVLALLGFLLALLLPAVQKVREAAARTQTINNLKMVAIALHSHHDVYKQFPPACGKFGGNIKTAQSIHVHLLPYMEQDPLYQQYVKEQGEDRDRQVILGYVAPADPSHPEPPAGIQNSAANLRVFSTKGLQTHWDAPMPALGKEEDGKARIPRDFPDGTANTIIFGTRYGVCGDGGSRYASAPNTNTAAMFGQNPAKVKAAPADLTATFLLHPAANQCRATPLMGHSFSVVGIEVALGDGSVRTVTARISAQSWNAAMCPNDGQPLGNDW